jgi:hypothetical protein
MKKIVLLLSVVAVSFALQAGDQACPKGKGACDKAKDGTCEKAGGCDKAKGEAKGCCPASKKKA